VGPSTQLGPYRILRLINRGGQGTVYLGYDDRLHRRVAIKIFRLPDHRATRERCLQEAQLVAAIHSPKVVQIHDLIDSPEHLALVMEYVPGCDLEEFLGAVRPSLGSVLTICADIAGALAVTRQQRIVHGDLKASNVLITDVGRAKLTDFGISLPAGRGGMEAGSYSALSPEQYMGRPLDVRSDLFVLGCLMYRMLTGQQPFWRDGRLDPQLLLEGDPLPVAGMVPPESMPPAQLLDLLEALLRKDPADRPANTHHVRRVLRDLSRTIPLTAGNTLLEEARPCFRVESGDDIPPRIPGDLVRAGRSRLDNTVVGDIRHWLRTPRGIATLGALALTAAMSIAFLLNRATPVHVERPVLQIQAGVELPEGLTANWLMETTLASLRERVGKLAATGPGVDGPDAVFYSPSVQEARGDRDRERLEIGLRCQSGLCVYGATRVRDGRTDSRQAILFPDTALSQWQQLIHAAVEALYP
jgi:tRNA A-37 threonylcarbamoyl transferase component Bud32